MVNKKVENLILKSSTDAAFFWGYTALFVVHIIFSLKEKKAIH